MRSPMTLTLGLVAGLLIGITVRAPRSATPTRPGAMDAASRDGSYLARLDVENARKPRLASGRWSSNSDRARFITGYEEGYQQAAETHNADLPKADADEKSGYQQGLSDGATDQAAS